MVAELEPDTVFLIRSLRADISNTDILYNETLKLLLLFFWTYILKKHRGGKEHFTQYYKMVQDITNEELHELTH